MLAGHALAGLVISPALAALAVVVCSVPVALAVHEGGHALAAVLLGARRIRVGLTRVEADVDGVGRTVAFLAAGPLANLVVGAVLVDVGGLCCGVVGAVNVVCAVVNLVPHGTSDGAQAWRLCSARVRGNDGATSLR